MRNLQLALATAALAACACSGSTTTPSPGAACTSDAQCGAGRTCASGTCVSAPADRTAPTVTRVLPSPATNLPVDAVLQLTFSEPMRIDPGAVTAGDVPLTVSLSDDGLTLSVVPSSLVPPVTVGVALGAGVTDLAGNPVSGQRLFDFQYPVWRKLGGAIGTAALWQFEGWSSTIDAASRPIVAWSEYGSTGTPGAKVYVARWDGSSWAPLGAALNTDATRPATWPSVAWRDGVLAVAFSQSTADGGEIDVLAWDEASSTWSAPLGGGLTPSGYGASLALDSAGYPVVAWEYVPTGGTNEVHVARWDGAGWADVGGALNRVPTEPATVPSLALDASDRPVVAFLEYPTGGGLDAYAVRWTGTAYTALGDGPLNAATVSSSGDPVVAVDAADRIAVAWGEGLPSDVYARIFDGTPSAAAAVNPSTLEADAPSLAVDATLGFVVGWEDTTAEECHVAAESGWSDLPKVTSLYGELIYCAGNRVATGPSGALTVLFRDVAPGSAANALQLRAYNR